MAARKKATAKRAKPKVPGMVPLSPEYKALSRDDKATINFIAGRNRHDMNTATRIMLKRRAREAREAKKK